MNALSHDDSNDNIPDTQNTVLSYLQGIWFRLVWHFYLVRVYLSHTHTHRHAHTHTHIHRHRHRHRHKLIQTYRGMNTLWHTDACAFIQTWIHMWTNADTLGNIQMDMHAGTYTLAPHSQAHLHADTPNHTPIHPPTHIHACPPPNPQTHTQRYVMVQIQYTWTLIVKEHFCGYLNSLNTQLGINFFRWISCQSHCLEWLLCYVIWNARYIRWYLCWRM